MKKLKWRALIPVVILVLSLGMAAPALADNGVKGQILQGIGETCGNNCPNARQSTDTLNNIIHLSINLFSAIVGIIAVIMIIVGGLKFITSGGDSNAVTSAKKSLTYAIIGLVIVALAQFIVHFVLGHTSDLASSSWLMPAGRL